MSDQRLTRTELIGMFGSSIPVAAIELINDAGADVDMNEMRIQLEAIAETHKALKDAAQIVLDAWEAEDPRADEAGHAAGDVHETGDAGNTTDIIEAFLKSLITK